MRTRITSVLTAFTALVAIGAVLALTTAASAATDVAVAPVLGGEADGAAMMSDPCLPLEESGPAITLPSNPKFEAPTSMPQVHCQWYCTSYCYTVTDPYTGWPTVICVSYCEWACDDTGI